MSVTAYPKILVNSASGSDSAASGAGPGTALTGTNASTNAGGTVVTLDGSPDLSGVATDGSHAIYLADSTAGHRNFAAINAVDNSAKTVTVEQAFTGSLSGKSWAIGGKRASIGGTNSKKLFDNNSGNGDAMPGWTMYMESGHAESIGGSINIFRAGDQTSGVIALRGDSSGTRPVITVTANATAFVHAVGAKYWIHDGYQIVNSNGTKTAAFAYTLTDATLLHDLVLGDATNKIQGIWSRAGGAIPNGVSIIKCEVKNTNSNAWSSDFTANVEFRFCHIHDCAGGLFLNGSTTDALYVIDSCILANNTGDALQLTSNSGAAPCLVLTNNTIHNNTGDGIEITGSGMGYAYIANNNFTANGGYGINSSAMGGRNIIERANNFGTGGTANTSGDINGFTKHSSSLAVDPQYANAGSGNYAIGTNVKALGIPTVIGATGLGTTATYLDIGAAQRQEPIPQGARSFVQGGLSGVTIHG